MPQNDYMYLMLKTMLSSSQIKTPNVTIKLSHSQMLTSIIPSRQTIKPNAWSIVIIQRDVTSMSSSS
jgi:hypothetical protein